MLGEDEISLNWRLDLSPIGRAQARSLHDFDRWANTLVLKGSMAYERLRVIKELYYLIMNNLFFKIGSRTRQF